MEEESKKSEKERVENRLRKNESREKKENIEEGEE